jgi:hypothetical protein
MPEQDGIERGGIGVAAGQQRAGRDHGGKQQCGDEAEPGPGPEQRQGDTLSAIPPPPEKGRASVSNRANRTIDGNAPNGLTDPRNSARPARTAGRAFQNALCARIGTTSGGVGPMMAIQTSSKPASASSPTGALAE